MSRSFKKHPAWTSTGSKYRKFAKKCASRAIRHCDDLPIKGNRGKTLYNSWNIADWKFIVYTPIKAFEERITLHTWNGEPLIENCGVGGSNSRKQRKDDYLRMSRK